MTFIRQLLYWMNTLFCASIYFTSARYMVSCTSSFWFLQHIRSRRWLGLRRITFACYCYIIFIIVSFFLYKYSHRQGNTSAIALRIYYLSNFMLSDFHFPFVTSTFAPTMMTFISLSKSLFLCPVEILNVYRFRMLTQSESCP